MCRQRADGNKECVVRLHADTAISSTTLSGHARVREKPFVLALVHSPIEENIRNLALFIVGRRARPVAPWCGSVIDIKNYTVASRARRAWIVVDLLN
jgi:hypothetical protein